MYVGSSMCLHSKVHRSMLLVSLRYVQYSMCRVTNFKVSMWQSALFYARSSLVLTLHSKMQCRQFHYAMLNISCDKFQSALCYAGPSLVLHPKMQSNSSMPLVAVYHALFSRSKMLF